MCETSKKGDIALTKVIADLTEKGYDVFTPISEYLKFDLVCFKDGYFYKLQVKYSGKKNIHIIRNTSVRQKSTGNVITKYKDGDFDYYAMYIKEKNIIIYPNIYFGGKTVRTSLTDTEKDFYWYEDFLNFTTDAEKRKLSDFGIEPKFIEREKARKVKNRPSKEELQKLVWEKPTTKIAEFYGVSDKAVDKWCKSYLIKKPERGYWTGKNGV